MRETEIPKQAILAELRRCCFCDDAVFAIQLALEEALCNAVKHGNQCDESKSVTVRYAINEEQAVIIVRDEGPGFAHESVPDPTAPDRISLPNGRGIMLMRDYVDEVTFNERGNEVQLVKEKS